MTFNISQTTISTLSEIFPTRAPCMIRDMLVGKKCLLKEIFFKFSEVYTTNSSILMLFQIKGSWVIRILTKGSFINYLMEENISSQ